MFDSTTKVCPQCKLEFPATLQYFSISKQNKSGLSSYCLKCNCANVKNWRKNNPDKVKAISKRRNKHNGEPTTAQQLRDLRSRQVSEGRTRTNGRMHFVYGNRARVPLSGIEMMMRSQKNLCWWCGTKITTQYHIDHRIAVSLGGSDDLSNLCISCVECNNKKSNKLPWQFNGRLL